MTMNTHFLLWCHLLVGVVFGGSNLDNLPDKFFYKDGDLLLGGLVYNQGYSLDMPCSPTINYVPVHQMAHSIAYAVDEYNKREDILPNVTLGYSILDECFRDIPAIPRFLQLLPILNSSADPVTSLSVGRHFDVVGIIGPVSGTPSIILATMTGFFQVPQIGATPNDELSDKVRYPYYFRTIPADRYQIFAMAKFIKAMQWEYISVVYVQADYGFNANRYIHKYATDEGVCIEEDYGLRYDNEDADFESLVEKLLNGKSRVVVIFIYADSMIRLLQTYARMRSGAELIWLLPESTPQWMINAYLSEIEGSFRVELYDGLDPKFTEYYESLNPYNTPSDPWLPMIWEQQYGCKMDPKDETDTDCRSYPDITGVPQHSMAALGHRPGEAVHAYAYALHYLIQDHCEYAVGDREELRKCVKPELLAEYLRNIEVETISGKINFDANQDNMRSYFFSQIQYDGRRDSYVLQSVALYDLVEKNISVFMDHLKWPKNLQRQQNAIQVPESVCSHPCQVGEVYFQGDVECCWECKQCRENEITTENQTKCWVCEQLTWPDPESNLTKCSPITPSYLTWDHVFAIGLIALAGGGLLSATFIIFVVVRHRERRSIKGASRESIGIILTGIVLAYLTIPSFIAKPDVQWCNVSRVGFSVSTTLIFGPLFLKSARVYRLFAASARFQVSVTGVGLHSQLVLSAIVIGAQIATVTVTSLTWPAAAVLRQPIATTKLVELQCDLSITSLLIPLIYNLFLAFLCSVMAFLTRHLPDNFNEAWYIFVTVCTNLFIWIAFLPTYFAAFYAYHKAALLALALFLNATIVLICLFGPKVYAVYNLKDEDIKVSDFIWAANEKSSSGNLKVTGNVKVTEVTDSKN